MAIKKIACIGLVLFLGTGFIQAQDINLGDVRFGVELAPGVTATSVEDPDPTPSSEDYTADGETTKLDNLEGFGFRMNMDYYKEEGIFFGTGLWINQKNLLIQNRDGDYTGNSHYQVTYLNLPLLAKYKHKGITENISLLFSFGPTIDLKVGEDVIGPDEAHYWNMANDLEHLDPDRGYNARRGPMALFNPLDISIYLGVDAVYEVDDQWGVTAGLGLHHGLFNMINPALKFHHPDRNVPNTPVQESVTIRSGLVSVNLGVRFSLE